MNYSNIRVNQVVGDTFEDLSISEMIEIQGAGDINLEKYTFVTASPSGVYTLKIISKYIC